VSPVGSSGGAPLQEVGENWCRWEVIYGGEARESEIQKFSGFTGEVDFIIKEKARTTESFGNPPQITFPQGKVTDRNTLVKLERKLLVLKPFYYERVIKSDYST